MPEFETLESQKIPFKNGTEFLELTIGVVRDGERANKYVRVARGYVDANGNDRYRKGGLTLPKDREALNALADAIRALDLAKVGGGEGGPEP
ncbi:MAG: hypothetical protein ACYDDF_10305 [Thermoplasmatota archaeon]